LADLDGRVALVTGAGRGIGLEYARRLSKDGATVAVADIDEQSAAAVATDIRNAGWSASHLAFDISDAEACIKSVAGVVARYGQIDILVNNAGLFAGGGFGLADQIALRDWQRMIDVNISGTFFMCRAAIPHMKRQGWGRIINQGSVSAYTANPGALHYSLSKAAISTMTKTLARELGRFGITVNAIAPGIIDTAATVSVFGSGDAAEKAGALTAVGRIGHADDLSPVVAFLCSSEAAYITGQTLVVDGGTIMFG
jgi:NAD(P)-dependent dehydrogenase (short-subunit alcohol dehydrogenase family)